MTEKARIEWGFEGYITSDCGAVEDVFSTHKYTSSTSETVKETLAAGMDTDCGSFMGSYLEESVADGTVDMELIDTALVHLLTVQFRLGMFDNSQSPNPYASVGKDEIDSDEHRQLALEAARQSITLLKNKNQALPLKKSSIDEEDVKKIALIGPHSMATEAMQANYEGVAPYLISPLEGLQMYGNIHQFDGCSIAGSEDPVDDQIAITEAADAVSDNIYDEIILIVGIDKTIEAEGLDRTSIRLSGNQPDLIEAVLAAANR